MKWFEENNYILLQWPARSPDLNPIENIWATIKQRLRSKNITTISELKTAWKKEWKKFKIEDLENYINSMPNRLESVIQNGGYMKKY